MRLDVSFGWGHAVARHVPLDEIEVLPLAPCGPWLTRCVHAICREYTKDKAHAFTLALDNKSRSVSEAKQGHIRRLLKPLYRPTRELSRKSFNIHPNC
jgi:hypothetical protein